VLAGFFLVFFLVTLEHMAGGGYVSPRAQLFTLLALLIQVATGPGINRFRRHIVIVSGLLVVISAVYYLRTYHTLGSAIEREIGMAGEMEHQSTVLPVVLPVLTEHTKLTSIEKPNALLHASGHLVWRNRMVDLDNYQGWKGNFPLKFRRDRNPKEHLAIDGRIELNVDELPLLDLSFGGGYGVVDYILVVGSMGDFRGVWEFEHLSQQLATSYEVVTVDRGRPSITLFRRVDPEAAGAG
jgi:hypothetical protein